MHLRIAGMLYSAGYLLCGRYFLKLGSKHSFMNKAKIPALFLCGGDKFTRQGNKMCSVCVIHALEKNEWRRKIRNIGNVNIRLL